MNKGRSAKSVEKKVWQWKKWGVAKITASFARRFVPSLPPFRAHPGNSLWLRHCSDKCNNLLFLHAVFECDMTSCVHGIGNGKKFRESKYFSEQVHPLNVIQHLCLSVIIQLQVTMYWSAYTMGNQVKH